MPGMDSNHLRMLAGYHMGTDLVERLAWAEKCQAQQREALAKAADRIDELEREVARMQAETRPSADVSG